MKKEWIQQFKSFATQTHRVWKILKKPSKQEFRLVAKISAIGILAVGVVGFIISTIMDLFGL
jgi:protein transport protein SEC61 subunit gamma and related proteins